MKKILFGILCFLVLLTTAQAKESKEYTYMSKSRGTREKDKLDASIIEPTLDEKSMEKISKMNYIIWRTKI